MKTILFALEAFCNQVATNSYLQHLFIQRINPSHLTSRMRRFGRMR